MSDASFDAPDMARRILRSAATASLGTLATDGGPFVTFVTVATDIDGAPLILVSGLAAHTRHLDRDDRASLLMQAPAGAGEDPLTGARLTLIGRFRGMAGDEDAHAHLLKRFLARHPKAEGYAGFGDFSIHRMVVDGAHLVAGFGRISRLRADDLLVAPAVAEAFALAEASLIETFGDVDPRPVAFDPDGVDVADNGVRRLCFPRRANDPGEVAALMSVLG
ncbi:hypothetical protein ANOBCDAF_02140 [Pleomorphomonas sp. T1.2MG-36]|uniref:HugZ family pyridoxamine 5'-phosphate oxidase n=1 Tax=Pleomorphomonas sp. T1.2MG-36 TaxID=3041167 RepID=UPI0024773945|nr:pyridoxamine 5'-phosphate oxidase family protein [Pleomorphomonas sp. T1.2MG-36]CAI9409885.1 hypothetical protein ANOBCDAF_02140 [Pleomorphomonas sp. T1.2MG-36]